MISVVLATHNESANIDRCLEAVKTWADEIIITDGESTDDTVKKAKSFDAKIISTTNKSNFHINKQLAMDAAKGELVLQLDADEVVDNELAEFIISTHKKILAGEALPAAWWVKRRNFFFGRFLTKGGQYPDPVIRLYQKGKARLPQKDVHEQMTVDGELGWADGHFLHYSNPTFADYLRKFNTYTSFAAEQQFNQGKKPSFSGLVSAFMIKPNVTFFSLYIRHRGLVDGVAGFLFALCSGLHHPVTYLKLCERYAQDQRPA
jgi:glycosyltransferase involved in cell wall biosynthesis